MPPAMNKYQLVMLTLGNARSRAPSISGVTKLPKVTGMAGTRKNQTITTPCKVNRRLYISWSTINPVGDIRFSRISAAAAPPRKKNAVMDAKYSSAIRLWSVVSSQDQIDFSSVR